MQPLDPYPLAHSRKLRNSQPEFEYLHLPPSYRLWGWCWIDHLLQQKLNGSPLTGLVDNQHFQPFAGLDEGRDCLEQQVAKRCFSNLAISLLHQVWDKNGKVKVIGKFTRKFHLPFLLIVPLILIFIIVATVSYGVLVLFFLFFFSFPFLTIPFYQSFECSKPMMWGLLDLQVNLIVGKPGSKHW